jgi:chromosome segregation and condensation protein ScpB
MFRFLIAAIAAASLAGAARAATRSPRLDPAVEAKTQTAEPIAAALAETGSARVVIVVATRSGRSAEELARAARDPAARAAVRREIAAAIDAVLASHPLSLVGAGKGAPAVIRMTSAPAFSALVDESELNALAADPRVISIAYDRPMTR